MRKYIAFPNRDDEQTERQKQFFQIRELMKAAEYEDDDEKLKTYREILKLEPTLFPVRIEVERIRAKNAVDFVQRLKKIVAKELARLGDFKEPSYAALLAQLAFAKEYMKLSLHRVAADIYERIFEDVLSFDESIGYELLFCYCLMQDDVKAEALFQMYADLRKDERCVLLMVLLYIMLDQEEKVTEWVNKLSVLNKTVKQLVTKTDAVIDFMEDFVDKESMCTEILPGTKASLGRVLCEFEEFSDGIIYINDYFKTLKIKVTENTSK